MSLTEAPQRARMRRALHLAIMALYCTAIFLALDFVYSYFFYKKDILGRVSHQYYHHGFAANFEGFDAWGPLRAKIHTNSLGFKDGAVRDVPALAAQRRVILIGDSFTEGVGMKFDDTFAGLLYRAGQARNEKLEFLNASAVSYSPVIYYKKIKYLLDAGLRFDEVVVFSDISDVQDEATRYFCMDDHPDFRVHCQTPSPAPSAAPSLSTTPADELVHPPKKGLADNFTMTDRLIRSIRMEWNIRTGRNREFHADLFKRAAWTKKGFDVGNSYHPAGIEGGIHRSQLNMRALSDLLRSRGIGLTIVVYPWAFQLAQDDRNSRQVQIWRDFCATNCKAFIDLFPTLFAVKDARSDWFEHLFIPGDVHYSPAGHRIIFRALAERLL